MDETQSLNLVHCSPKKRREEVRKEGLMAVMCSEIPEELVGMVVERVVCVDDLIRFGAVCKLWRSVSISEKQKKKVYSPLIMLASADNDNLPSSEGEGVRSFMIPYHRSGYGDEGVNPNKKMRSFDLKLTKAQGRRCWGSPYGWVVTFGWDLDIGLLNPLTGAHLPLLPQPKQNLDVRISFTMRFVSDPDPDHVISELRRKFALGWHPSSQSWLVMTIFGVKEQVAFAFAGIGKQPSPWTCIESTVDAQDVILFQGQIYLIAYKGELKVYDLKEGAPPKAIHIAWPPKHYSDTNYLVEIAGNLHFVARYFDPGQRHTAVDTYVTTGFRVWRFNFPNTKWDELDDLGENALFLGNNTSFVISTITYPDFSSNCIYFTDDRYPAYGDQFCDMGVYDYAERTIKRPYDIAEMGDFSKFSRPTFFMPTL